MKSLSINTLDKKITLISDTMRSGMKGPDNKAKVSKLVNTKFLLEIKKLYQTSIIFKLFWFVVNLQMK